MPDECAAGPQGARNGNTPAVRYRNCAGVSSGCDCSDGANARGLRALGALADLELDLLVLLQGAEAASLNFRVVDKHIARSRPRGR